MTIFRPSHISGRTIRQQIIGSGFGLVKDKVEDTVEELSELSGKGLEQMTDKLDKLIVKPRRKVKNIQFNP
tara:strand:- start:1066 stop:1278 length:213 start_codon:yes stop_codon:yes gene_type:complete